MNSTDHYSCREFSPHLVRERHEMHFLSFILEKETTSCLVIVQ